MAGPAGQARWAEKAGWVQARWAEKAGWGQARWAEKAGWGQARWWGGWGGTASMAAAAEDRVVQAICHSQQRDNQ